MSALWDPEAEGLLTLPSGRLVRGRGLGYPLPKGPRPDYALYLLGHEPPTFPWDYRWVRWPDFRLPAEEAVAYVRKHYSSHAVETPWQARYVRRFEP